MRSFFAASMLLAASAFVFTGCAATAVDRDESEEIDTGEVAGALSAYGEKLVGAYKASNESGDFSNIVLKSDGTFFADETIYCVKAPCDPIRTSGKFIGYKPKAGKYYGFLRLVMKGGSKTYRVVIGKPNESFKLSADGGKTWIRFDSTGTYCAKSTDCNGQSYFHPMCVGEAVCGEDNRCGWKCASEPVKCDYSNPDKKYIGTSKESCMTIKYFCESGYTSFSDDCGCGCEKAPTTTCVVTGCSGQICANEEMMSTCEWRPEYACYASAKCAPDATGKCGWVKTPELESCLKSPPSGS